MKKLFLILSTIALVVVGCKKEGKSSGENSENSISTPSTGAIAYINIDSLMKNYDMYIDLRTTYEEKAMKADKDLTGRGRALERDMRDYQEKAQNGLITRATAQTMEENLGQKQQNFMQHREKVMAELAEEESVLMNQIQYSITQYVKEFNKDYRYDMIMTTSAGGPILSARTEMDITLEVLEGLNKQYAKEKSGNKSAAPAADSTKQP